MQTINDYLASKITFTPAVVGFLKQDNRVLLGLRKKVSLGLGHHIISGIGGKVGDSEEIKHETYAQALIREFQEEIGVTPIQYTEMGRVRFIWPHNPNWRQDCKVYVIEQWQGEPIETEAIRPQWYPINNLPAQEMWEDNMFWVPEVLAVRKVDMIFVLGQDKKIIEKMILD